MNLAQSVRLSDCLSICSPIQVSVCLSVCYTVILKIGSLIFFDFLNEVRKLTEVRKLKFCAQSSIFYFSNFVDYIFFS